MTGTQVPPQPAQVPAPRPSGGATAEPQSAAATSSEPPKAWAVVVGLLFWAAVISGVLWKQVGPILTRWWWVVAGLLALLAVALLIRPIRASLVRATPTARVAVLIFVVTPLLLGLISIVVLLPDRRFQVAAVRAVFLLIACLLPATLYYLFIANLKYSILNEFLTNLDFLGLLRPLGQSTSQQMSAPGRETLEGCRRRVLTYLRRFEAAFGPAPENLVDRIRSGPPEFDGLMVDQRSARGAAAPSQALNAPETQLPVVVATLLIAIGWGITLPPWPWPDPIWARAPMSFATAQTFWLGVFEPVETPVRFAFLGAYFFALQLLFRRYIRRDLRASAYVAVALRILLAVIGAWAATAALRVVRPDISRDLLLVVGFAIGVFPLVAWQIVQAAVKRLTGASVLLPSLQTEMPVSDLDGLTVWQEVRLEEEDIENVPSMATADVVELMLNTRIPPGRIIDWVDQAILYTALGPVDKDTDPSPRETLRKWGIRTATGLVHAYRSSVPGADRQAFEQLLGKDDRSRIVTLVDTVVTNPNFDLAYKWRAM